MNRVRMELEFHVKDVPVILSVRVDVGGQFRPPKRSGPPETCYPGESPDAQIVRERKVLSVAESLGIEADQVYDQIFDRLEEIQKTKENVRACKFQHWHSGGDFMK